MSVLRAGFFALAILFFSVTAKAEESEPADTPVGGYEDKTLDREVDYIIVVGKRLRNNLRRDIAGMSLYAYADGKMRTVPFQIDEVDPDGEWILPMVPPALQNNHVKPARDVDDGLLDENDELVFMIRDSGGRAPKEHFPEGAAAVDEIALVDPVDGGKAWVYLCSFPEPPSHNGSGYVEYSTDRDLITTDTYWIGFRPELPIAPGSLHLNGSDDILDQMKVRFRAKVLFFTVSLDETCFLSELSFYKSGPVRVIRRTSNAVQVTKIFRTPSAAVENVYYDRIVVIPIRVRLPFSVRFFKKIIEYIKVRGCADLRNLHGWRLRYDFSPEWVTIDGKMEEFERQAVGRDFQWFLIHEPGGKAFFFRLILDRAQDGSYREVPVTSSLYYVDDDNLDDPPEFVPGQSPNVGFWLNNLRELERGMFYCYAMFMSIDDYREGDEVELLDIVDRPVEIGVNEGR